MANEKMNNAMMLDPERFKIAKNMSVMPGGPMNNNPMNVTSLNQMPASMDGISRFPYGDSGIQQGPGVFPVPNSGMPGSASMNMQKQPPAEAADPMEGARVSQDATNRGLMANGHMVLGSAPMEFPGNMPGTSGMMLPPANSMNAMTPGSTPTKIKKKGKK